MELRDLGEFGFIDRIRDGMIVRDAPGLVGIGDDCAVFRCHGGCDILLTTDMLVEGVHFRRERIPPRLLGRKAIAVNLSDIAACGGAPKEAVVALAVPPGVSVEYLDLLCAGMRECAHQYEVNILGGDTTSSPRELVIGVALTGEVESGRAVLRRGARAGDLIFLTGTVGDSPAGLDILTHRPELEHEFADLVAAHLDPRPHVSEGRMIGESGVATAMIDVSDGIASDLAHVCRASGLGARIDWGRIPLSAKFREYLSRSGANPRKLALSGGEDYVLLCTANPAHGQALRDRLGQQCRCPLVEIGTTVAGAGIELILPDGSTEALLPTGWDHFRHGP
jgi:thiamine-monophosphate kinase